MKLGLGRDGAQKIFYNWGGDGMGHEKIVKIGVGLKWGLTIKPLLGWGRDGAD